jgi:putative transposase
MTNDLTMKKNISKGYAALRKHRVSAPQNIYFVTINCDKRLKLFSDWCHACVAAKILAEERLWRESKLLCWVLMPDHWHGLVQLSDGESLSKLMQRVKAVSAKTINEARNDSGSIWQKGFYDHSLRKEESIASVAYYIIANPLRAGLARNIEDYSFWGAYWLSHDGKVVQ